jgi:hypothetical protein
MPQDALQHVRPIAQTIEPHFWGSIVGLETHWGLPLATWQVVPCVQRKVSQGLVVDWLSRISSGTGVAVAASAITRRAKALNNPFEVAMV